MTDQIEARWKRFGQWIAEKREKLGLTQAQAGERMGVVKQEWYRLEKGRSTTQKTVIAIAEALEVDTDEALTRAGFQPLNSAEIEDDEDLAVLFSGYPQMDAEQKERFKPILQVVRREMERILAEKAEKAAKKKAKG